MISKFDGFRLKCSGIFQTFVNNHRIMCILMGTCCQLSVNTKRHVENCGEWPELQFLCRRMDLLAYFFRTIGGAIFKIFCVACRNTSWPFAPFSASVAHCGWISSFVRHAIQKNTVKNIPLLFSDTYYLWWQYPFRRRESLRMGINNSRQAIHMVS